MYDTAYRWMSVETPLTTSIMNTASGSIEETICASTPTVFAGSHATLDLAVLAVEPLQRDERRRPRPRTTDHDSQRGDAARRSAPRVTRKRRRVEDRPGQRARAGRSTRRS